MNRPAEILQALTTCLNRGRWLQQQADKMTEAMNKNDDTTFNQTYEETIQQLKWRYHTTQQLVLPLRNSIAHHTHQQLKLFAA